MIRKLLNNLFDVGAVEMELLKKLKLRLKGVPAEALREPMSLNAVFEISNDEKFYWALVERGLYFFNMEEDEGNTEGEQVLTDIYAFRFETNGGGTHKYLFNSSGDTVFRLSHSLQAVGAHELAESFRRISSLFPGGIIAKNRKERWNQMDPIGDRLEDLCESFTKEFFETEENEELNLVTLSTTYARQNRGKFERGIIEPGDTPNEDSAVAPSS